MELTNEFKIDRPVDEAYRILNDLEFIAPCMPGAQLTEVEGEEYRGTVKIKVGPITAKYKGKASFVSQDPESHVSVLKAEGRDPRQGNANAIITATLTAISDTETRVGIDTDLKLAGKVASFGRGAIEDVSKKILGQFSDNLEAKIAEAGEGDAPAATSAETGATVETSSAQANQTVRKISAPEAEPVNILSVTGDSLTKRLAPILAGALALLILRLLLKGKKD